MLVQNDMSTAVIWSKSKPDSNMVDAWAYSMACHHRATGHIAGCCHLVHSLTRSRATCHIAGCNNSIRHIENHFSPYFTFIGFLMQIGL